MPAAAGPLRALRSASLVGALLFLGLGGCARSKSEPVDSGASESASVAASSSAFPSTRPGIKGLLCRDGLHKPGDHWKEDCNPCRCAADGDITCTRYVCGDH